MANNRDDFTKRTIDILGKRVSFHCSNPNCRKITIGPNDAPDEALIIGIAAHITAASPNGPRYDPALNSEQRAHISNGIWLCSNCASMIDKNLAKYTVALLHQWKNETEAEISKQLEGWINKNTGALDVPFLEADLIWAFGGRWNLGYSPKNKQPLIFGEDPPIIFWDLDWNFVITLYNNSRFDAHNIQIESVGKVHFTRLPKIKKINVLPTLQNMDLDAKYIEPFEGTPGEADEILKHRIPKNTEGLCLKISYYDHNRTKQLFTFARIENGQFTNTLEL